MLENNYMQTAAPLTNKINTPRNGKRYVYGQTLNQNTQQITKKQYTNSQTKQTDLQPQLSSSASSIIPTNSVYTSQKAYIAQLEEQLKKQKQKSKMIEQHAVRQQTNILQQISMLEMKFNQVQKQKMEMKQLLEESYKEINQYKKVKGIAQAMINMMVKVEGKTGTYHEAWRWIKKVVWEYQTIKTKALQWKKAYDMVKQQQRSDTFSNQSNESCSSFQQKQ